METVVLPAQDHLAQERYRQGGVMSGMIYPLGGLPRTRRKVRSPHQVFVAASLQSGPADKSNVNVADSRSGLVSPMDMSLGILRTAPSAASTSHLPPSSELKLPHYRFSKTTPHGFVSHESSSKKQQQQHQLAAPVSTQAAVTNSISVSSNQLLRTRSDGVLGELLQQQGLKRGVDDRRKALDSGVEGAKNFADRTFEKNGERSERRKGVDRRAVDKKPITVSSANQGDKSNPAQRKAGVITILQRPQTKEAAAENIALFNGSTIEDATKQTLKSARVTSQHHVELTAIDIELFTSVAFDGKDREIDSLQSRSSRNVSPKSGTKKKLSRDFPSKAASRAAAPASEVAQGEPRKTQNSDLRGESRRPKTAQRLAENDSLELRRSIDTDWYSDEFKRGVELKSLESNDEILSIFEGDFNTSHILLSSSVDQIDSSRPDDGVGTTPGVLHRVSSDSLVGEIGQAFGRQGVISRSGSFRDASRGSDNGAEGFFLPSSPPKPSERWAGPAYTNSPPPSTLPFPTFPLQRVKSSMTEATLADAVLRGPLDTNVEFVSSSAPPSPTRVASLLFSASAMQAPFVDPSSATKDLRRILNLNVEDSFEVSSEWSESGVETATQSLKRMLQLG